MSCELLDHDSSKQVIPVSTPIALILLMLPVIPLSTPMHNRNFTLLLTHTTVFSDKKVMYACNSVIIIIIALQSTTHAVATLDRECDRDREVDGGKNGKKKVACY